MSDPDGFSFKFVKSFWSIFKDDLLALFDNFHRYGEFDPQISESFISLIPKVKNTSCLNDFGPFAFGMDS